MGLREAIEANYIDANGLVCNRRCLPTEVNPSGNGICYSGEYVAILKSQDDLDDNTIQRYIGAVSNCDYNCAGIYLNGLLTRGPGQPDLESVDDYYGYSAGAMITGNWSLASDIIDYGWAHWGCFNNTNPDQWTRQSFLWRQPQLICALYAAAQRKPLWIYPLRLYTALVIATSCISAPSTDCDSRRLSWLLIQTMSPVSWLCRQAAKIWQRRLMKQSGGLGMKYFDQQYYEVGHPFIGAR